MKKIFVCSIFLLLVLNSCDNKSTGADYADTGTTGDYRQKMRDFVTGISTYAKAKKNTFAIIPQNGHEIVFDAPDRSYEFTAIDPVYINAIDGIGREDLHYGYTDDDAETPAEDYEYMNDQLEQIQAEGKTILVTDYCSTLSKMDRAYALNRDEGYVPFVAPERDLNIIPSYPSNPYRENDNSITSLSGVQNFLYLINPENFNTKSEMLTEISDTNYDLLIIDYYFNDTELSASDIETLKQKKNGSSRLVIAYMSIGEAEDYRFYWQSDWEANPPSWLEAEDPNWEGNYYVRYWYDSWQQIIFGSPGAYLDKIIQAGFDGVYLDIIDAFEYFEYL